MEWYVGVLKKYADFSGRARRKEYWMFFLINIIIGIVLGFLATILKTSILSTIYSLAVLIPGIAVCIRRLHDIGKSGWWWFIALIPLVGPIWLLVLVCTEGDSSNNQYGSNPKTVV
ncbi:DUF805 domain-containing protein [Cellulosilyticum lentocellum]|uniref:Inner membrane protein YhaI n=1 Tax=Cellulosilyticum lentocellum (strain ATCC 49066 / DSM 5427 / NCIMB 11756 / RHM5) TaxID=642492 RepID=F2JLX0_CELLD|nr:DUF805 domain-containing protein [Cellulosilyticum lentocellum]ADZ84646.1 protein of unknown function DUF805 [Cellulosilyticum lentocellum DSM 5427]